MTAPPTVVTLNASVIQNNSVTLNANISYLGSNSDGSEEVNEYGFLYNTNASQSNGLQLGKSGVTKIAGTKLSNTGSFSFVLAGLSPCLPYYFRAFAVNDGGVSYGEVSNFPSTNQNFSISGVDAGWQNNILCPYSTHSYEVTLSHERVYSLSVEATSNISDNISVYEDINAEPLYVKPGPFSESADGMNVTFSGISGGTRYMLLPLVSNSHRVVFSNTSDQSQNYSLNLEEYLGSIPSTGRLLLEPQKMGYYDSTNDIRYFWVHILPNKNIQVELDAIRADGSIGIILGGLSVGFNSFVTNTQILEVKENFSQYSLLSMRSSTTNAQTNARFIFRLVD